MDPTYLVVASDPDPVASRVLALWGTPPAIGGSVDGAPIRQLSPRSLLLKRPVLHVHDERLDLRLPSELRDRRPTLIFPSIHRSGQHVECLTVHPLGNPGPTAEVGGRPRTLTPTDPRRMADALRRIAEGAAGVGLSVTFEATHHGPELAVPAFFVEIGYGQAKAPPEAAIRILAKVIPELSADPGDRIALAVGGGHYAPHFTDLVRTRGWAFGHILSRHALGVIDARTARSAWAGTEGAEGVVYARAEDAKHPALDGIGPRLRDGDAPARTAGAGSSPSSRWAAGT